MKKKIGKIAKGLKDPGKIINHLRSRYFIDIKLDRYYVFAPQQIFLNLSWYCNFKCKMCDIGIKNKESNLGAKYSYGVKSLLLGEWIDFIDSLGRHRPLIQLTGSEPTLYPHFLELIKYLKKKEFPVAITTNGWLLEKYMEQLIESGVENIGISIDGLNSTHDYIRGMSGSFAKVINCIELYNSYIKKYPRSKTQLVTNTTITEYNYNELVDIYNMLNERGVPVIAFSHLWFKTDLSCQNHNKLFSDFVAKPTNLNANIGKIPYDKLVEDIKVLMKKKDILLFPRLSLGDLEEYYKNPDKHIGKTRCLLPWRQIDIMPDGEIQLGGQCFEINARIGNILEDNLLTVWKQSMVLSELRRLLKKYNGYLPGCSRCCVLYKY